ncbi:CRISPR-associated protein Cas4 [Chryseobacterium suipulveris]|uniref:CRISPR-associated exonuclease Cas4 n=1 Tax=Chryseobacterium suipulveris TaxID=2929800 RepID=A0ABY4BM58_9FLAO|nr:CRISPR-associated protein Cas4 [Chryseobacterium suipulveris]UOE39969.1 CRISPR-associated protein Cas4 [Chryseobacterium suipulveris]
MHLIATHINYYIVCPRKLWLFANGINMEHTSDTVYDGKLLHETSYPQRAEKYNEIEVSASFDGIDLSGKIDFYDAKNKIIHETKRSDKVEEAHEWQVKFYIWLLELNGIEGVTATLEYPKLRRTDEVLLSQTDRLFLQETVQKVKSLIEAELCPPKINAKICKSCSYYELCYIEE